MSFSKAAGIRDQACGEIRADHQPERVSCGSCLLDGSKITKKVRRWEMPV